MSMNTSVEFEGEDLVIRIPKDFVYSTIVYGNNSTIIDVADQENYPDHSVMEDFEAFSVYLLNSIREEDEIGWSLINDLLYKAAEQAAENGAEGLKYSD